MQQVTEVTSVAQWKAFVSTPKVTVLFFYAKNVSIASSDTNADWLGPANVLFTQLAMLHPRLSFCKVDAEAVPALSTEFHLEVVPTFIISVSSNVVDRIEGMKVAEVAQAIDRASKRLADPTGTTETESKAAVLDDALRNRLLKLTTASPVMVFMKGSPNEPKCGFSRKTIELLKDENIECGTFDILTDDTVRQGLKVFSSWPTFPQVYVNGAFVGGLDILTEMKEEGALADQFGIQPLDDDEVEKALFASLTELIQSAPVLLFMKGTPNEPKCGFSRKTVELLRGHHIKFATFDILSDESVRQGLKKMSNWPTYPQLYVHGALVGGLDILTEMAEEGDLADQLGVEKKERKRESPASDLSALINRAPVMIFIKGTPDAPQCGFSRQLLDTLNDAGFVYDYFDITTDDKVRQGLKAFSNWPTYPQVYVNGELIGGLDIIQQLKDDGELEALKP
ncbi:Grx4 family monothiol glutaredoxin [Aphanomyces invadans]|uniref:Grx4 family monothiol glutaredoxin n=1 Tax=Aphanomyces invadans TaxID=157072 RepID=A0A024TG69_9STRA|nr:Grx4 family monothiol glutaredoxin [Aphanomyces invadans]ETV93160.1 Grx4 family monothiol glutaredoxin [Aphanomyces invadans]|eukprot:XP_008878182.1 Grx4 family monothiol glutaredoxin [Aphanomyces invadans]